MKEENETNKPIYGSVIFSLLIAEEVFKEEIKNLILNTQKKNLVLPVNNEILLQVQKILKKVVSEACKQRTFREIMTSPEFINLIESKN